MADNSSSVGNHESCFILHLSDGAAYLTGATLSEIPNADIPLFSKITLLT